MFYGEIVLRAGLHPTPDIASTVRNGGSVVQAGLDFRPEADTDGIVRCTVDYQSQNPGNHIFSHQGSIDRFPNDNYDGFH